MAKSAVERYDVALNQLVGGLPVAALRRGDKREVLEARLYLDPQKVGGGRKDEGAGNVADDSQEAQGPREKVQNDPDAQLVEGEAEGGERFIGEEDIIVSLRSGEVRVLLVNGHLHGRGTDLWRQCAEAA